MKKWDVEMTYGIGFAVMGIEAETQEDAISEARKLIEDETTVIYDNKVDGKGFEFDCVTYVQQN